MRPIDGDTLIEILTTAIRNVQGVTKLIGAEDDPEIKMAIKCYTDILDGVKEQPTIEPEPRWIPFLRRPLTDDEKKDHPGWDFILDCKLPEDYQRILISVDVPGHEPVQADTFYRDGDDCSLDSSYEFCKEAVAWMPRPKPYSAERKTDER